MERSQSLVTENEDKIREDEHVKQALRSCGYPDWTFNKVEREIQAKGVIGQKKKTATRFYATTNGDHSLRGKGFGGSGKSDEET